MRRIPNKLEELFSYLDRTRAALERTARDMNPAFATIRPRDAVWSAADNLAHLALVEGNVVKLMTKSIEAARAQGVAPDTSDVSFLASLDRWRVPEPDTKSIAPARITPDGEKSIEDSLESLEQSRKSLKSIVIENCEIDLHSIKRAHPSLGDLDMYQWALFVGQHEERHRRQIERTLAEVTERAAECAPIV